MAVPEDGVRKSVQPLGGTFYGPFKRDDTSAVNINFLYPARSCSRSSPGPLIPPSLTNAFPDHGRCHLRRYLAPSVRREMRPGSGESVVSNKSRGRRWTNQSRRQLVHPSSEHVRGRSSTGQPVPGPYPGRRGVSPRMSPIGHL